MQVKMERVEAEREAEQRRMVEILQYMQRLGTAIGVVPPPSLFAPPPHYSTPVSINVLVCMFMLTVKPSGV